MSTKESKHFPQEFGETKNTHIRLTKNTNFPVLLRCEHVDKKIGMNQRDFIPKGVHGVSVNTNIQYSTYLSVQSSAGDVDPR